MIKCISVQQPWAWLLTHAAEYPNPKDIENRDWNTSYRGLILIHAGKKQDENAHLIGLARRLDLAPDVLDTWMKATYEYGGIVGYATLSGVVTKSDSPWFRGRYGFVLTEQHTLPFIPLRGQLGLFDVSAEIIEQVLLKAAKRNDDDLENLLQVVVEEMDEARATRLLDKVHQVLSEDVRDLRGWR